MSAYASIDVPEAHYPAVVAYLASLMSGKRESPTLPAESEVVMPVESGRAWSEDVWERVWPIVTDNTRKMLIALAENGGEWVQIARLEESVGSFSLLQGSFISFTKRMQRVGPTMWPFEVETDEATGRARYRMDLTMAAIVLRLAGSD